ncbi:TolC family outer membrane protein [Moritella marina ATCC 15381]|uniref:TolC family outer membrane protein n=1 Tax=Moritella marina ATCC 15381 TaxID=1202962 RepID=A0A5J6WJ59_MORMI|nr:TolC family outer membrane protein [Moritella marina]QFI36825.1 TolC family outer membrane protein [Moritella marina ATCC 15381]
MPISDALCQPKLLTKGSLYQALLCSVIGWSATVNAQSVEEAVAMTLSTHPDIRIAFTKFKVREEQVQQAEAGYLPNINVTAGYGYEYTNSPGTRATADETADLNRGEFGVSLKQSLFSGFQTSSDVSRTSYATSAEQWRLFSTAEDVALDVTKVYTNLLKSQRILELSERNLSTHKTIFGQIEERTSSGLGSIADLSQITGRLARAQSNVISAKNNYLDNQAQFIRVTDQQPDNLVIPIPDVELLPVNRETGLRDALVNHPVVKSSNNDITSARYQHDAAKSNYYPKVTFEVDANFNNDLDGVDGNGVGGHSNDVTAMVRLSYNLYTGGRDKALAKETAYQITEASEINRSVHRQITEGFTLAWNAHELLGLQMQYIKEHVIASKDSQAAYEQQFKLGQRSLLDLLDTENELFEARKEFVDAEFDEIVTQYRLLNATGQLLDSLRVTRPAVWQGENQYAGGVE